MILGRFRDHLPRVRLDLPGRDGRLVPVEFVVDTGFEGDLSVPSDLVRLLDAQPRFLTRRKLADGTHLDCPVYQIVLDWNGEPHTIEALVLENNPLLGTLLLDGCRLEVEMEESGEVVIELPG